MGSDSFGIYQGSGLYPRGFPAKHHWPWPLVKASKLVTLNYGKALRAQERVLGSVPVYGTNGQCGWHNSPLNNGPSVILGRKGQGPLGVEWCDVPFWVIDTAYYISLKSSKIDLRYFYYLVKYIGLNHLKDGTSNPSLSRNTFAELLLPLPSKQQQLQIVEIVKSLDDKIELNRQMNSTLEAMAQALFKSWFVDFSPVIDNAIAAGNPIPAPLRARAEVRRALGDKRKVLPNRIQKMFPDRFEFDEDMGWIPGGWDVSTIENTLTRLKVRRRYKRTEVQEYGLTPVFEQGASILLGYHNGPPEISATIDEPAFIFGDHTCITKLSVVPFSISQNVIPLKGRSLNTYWVYYSILGKQTFEEYRRHWMELIIRPVVKPPSILCKLFGNRITSGVQAQAMRDRMNSDLTRLRDTLLPKLLSGSLKLPQAEKLIADIL